MTTQKVRGRVQLYDQTWKPPFSTVLSDPAYPFKTAGDRFILTGTLVGEFVGHDNQYAIWNGSYWEYENVYDGDVALRTSNNTYYEYRISGGWNQLTMYPQVHQLIHNEGGGDELKLDDLGIPDDNTDLNVSTSRHGLVPKLTNDATKFFNGVGDYASLSTGGAALLGSANNFTAQNTFGDGANQLVISSTGDVTLQGTAKYERHVQIIARPSGNPATQMSPVTFFSATGLQASSSTDQYAGFQWEIPDDWDGTDVYVEIDWFPDSGAISGTSAIRWVIEYRSIAEGELMNNGTLVTLDNGVGGDTSDYSQYQTKHTRFTLTYNNANQPLTAQDHVYFLVHRDTGVANDFSGTVTVPAFEIIYNSKGFPTSN